MQTFKYQIQHAKANDTIHNNCFLNKVVMCNLNTYLYIILYLFIEQISIYISRINRNGNGICGLLKYYICK